jgi:outer membrane protein OmpA-like peptidoglycan-associated protein
MRRLTLLTSVLLSLSLAGSAFAQGGLLSYKLKPAVQKGQGYPQILLEAQSDFQKVDVVCDRDGTEVTMSAGTTKSGKTLTFDLKQPEGEFRYRCEARGYYGSGEDEYFDLPMNFSAFLGGALSINISRKTIDRDGQNLIATSDRVVTRTEVKVYSPDGLVHEATEEMDDNEPGDDLWIGWEGPEEVLRLDITLYDKWGFYVFEQIFPWSLEIPHDDVHFDTGSHAIGDSETPKVDKAYKDIDTIVARYSKFVEVQLFVGGYTDTVGDKASNQGLSERRARSIAAALRERGFKGKIYYQGFGERALKIATEDSTDEILNRRAVYLLASKAPVTSASMPSGNWKPL